MITLNRIKKTNFYHHPASRYERLEAATDLAAISGRKVLVLLDEQNLSITAKKLGYRLRYGLLAERINAAADSAEIHIFTATETGDVYSTRQQFKKLGYLTHLKIIRNKCYGKTCDSNIDNHFAFWSGMQARRTIFDIIVLGSGDYGLSGEVAKEIYEQRRNKAMSIMTLSLPGSTSQKLDAETNPNITANLEIGLDMLEPLARSKSQFAAATVSSFRKFRFDNIC